MKKLLADLPFFVEVARQKSFSRAAEALEAPVATVSRRVAALERELGVKLLHRNTRSVDLTEAGRDYFISCEFILAEADNAREKLRCNQSIPTGRVRLAVQSEVFFLFMRGVLSDFVRKYPGIELYVDFSNQMVDLRHEPYDLDLRGGELPDSDLKVRRLGISHSGVYAAPDLLAKHRAPSCPEELGNMPFIVQTQNGHYRLVLRRGEETASVSLRPAHRVNSIGLAMEFLQAGLGAACVSPALARFAEAQGLLVRVLPEWQTGGTDISLIMPPGDLPHRVRLLADHLVAHFAALNLDSRELKASGH